MKNFTSSILATVIIGLSLSACTAKETQAPAEVKTEQVEIAPIDAVLAGAWREAEAKRDKFRHPKQTLAFFGLKPGQSVIEVFPGGGGWYTTVLAPYIAKTGGTYTAAVFDEGYGERGAALNERFKQKFSDADIFGTINTVPFGAKAGPMMDGEADLILSFRNVHSWMGRGYEKKAFADFYQALKPGGVLGIVEHRLPETAEQNPKAPTGYVQASYTKALAAEAGFEFVGASDVNANPKDTADHPFGVWTLPPVSRTPKAGDEGAEGFDAQKYLDIGESDRFTLKFKKPE